MVNVLFRVLFHPGDVFYEIRVRKKNYLHAALFAVALLFFSSVIEYQYTDFVFNQNRTDRLNIWFILFRTVVLFLLWVLSNWAFCTLFSGEGRLSQIFILSAFSLMPYILSLLLKTFLSAFLTLDEGIFLTWLLAAGEIYSVILLLFGLNVVHNFSMKKTFLSVLFSIVGIAIIIFLCVLLFSLFQQFCNFVVTVSREIYLILEG